MIKQLARSYPGRAALIALLFTILIGFLILSLPICYYEPISKLDLFFTATSATCVCGSLTIPLSAFTPIGQAVIIALSQIGGLGLITLTLIAAALFVELGMGTQFMAGYILETNSMKDIKPILIFIIGFTLLSELLGALFFLPFFLKDYSLSSAIYHSVFHAISSFCNVGLVLSQSVHYYLQSNYLFLLGTSILIFLGGIGFLVWYDVIKWLKPDENKRHNLSLHSKVVFSTTFYLLISSGLIIWLVEKNKSMADYSTIKSLVYSLFTALSMKSTGFALIPLASFAAATMLIVMAICFIGSAPGSAGSGIKVTTLALAAATVRSTLFNNKSVELKSRSIPDEQVGRAFTIIVLSIFWVICVLFCLLLSESGSFKELLMETLSAFSTLGLSIKNSTSLTIYGKLLICCTMIAGRVGALSLMIALTKQRRTREFSYPAERVLLN